MRFLRDAAVTMLILVVVGGVVGYAFVRNGVSARTEPSRLASLLARRLRHLAIPTAAEQQKNPFAGQADTWREVPFIRHLASPQPSVPSPRS